LNLEVESKFAVASPTAVRGRLEQIGARAGPQQLQVDTYYAHPARDFWRSREAFRWRRRNQSNVLTYKGPQLPGPTKSRAEIELAVADGEAGARSCAALLDALGFTPIATVRKRRVTLRLGWQGWDVEVALDQVDGLGAFVEVEILCGEGELGPAQEAVRSLAAAVGLEAPEPRTYLELMLHHRTPPAGRP